MFFYHGKRAKTAGRAGTAHGRANGHTRRQSGKNGHTRAKKGIQYIVVYERSKHTIYSGMKGKKGRTAGRKSGTPPTARHGTQDGRNARRTGGRTAGTPPRTRHAAHTCGTAGRAHGRHVSRNGNAATERRRQRHKMGERDTGGTLSTFSDGARRNGREVGTLPSHDHFRLISLRPCRPNPPGRRMKHGDKYYEIIKYSDYSGKHTITPEKANKYKANKPHKAEKCAIILL